MITNKHTPGDTNLNCYRSVTLAVKADSTMYYLPSDDLTVANVGFPFYMSESEATANAVNIMSPAAFVLRDVTKKAVFKFTKHISVAPRDYIAEYLMGLDDAVDPSIAHINRPFAWAKDGEEFEIYGIDEIRKFEHRPIASDAVDYFITISLFK